jgi:hypothetical protein
MVAPTNCLSPTGQTPDIPPGKDAAPRSPEASNQVKRKQAPIVNLARTWQATTTVRRTAGHWGCPAGGDTEALPVKRYFST